MHDHWRHWEDNNITTESLSSILLCYICFRTFIVPSLWPGPPQESREGLSQIKITEVHSNGRWGFHGRCMPKRLRVWIQAPPTKSRRRNKRRSNCRLLEGFINGPIFTFQRTWPQYLSIHKMIFPLQRNEELSVAKNLSLPQTHRRCLGIISISFFITIVGLT